MTRNRQTLSSNGAGKDRGSLVQADALRKMFPLALEESAYSYDSNGTTAVAQTIKLKFTDVWGKGQINRQEQTIKDGQAVNSQSSFNNEHLMDLSLPTSVYGTAVANNQAYQAQDSTGKANFADSRFTDRTELTTIIAHVRQELATIKKLVIDKAIQLQLINQRYLPIDMNNPEINKYFSEEVAPRLSKLANTYSLDALTKPGAIFEGGQIYTKVNAQGFVTTTLYHN